MNEFESIIAHSSREEHFAKLFSHVQSWTEEQRQAYGDRFPIQIFTTAGFSEDTLIPLSAN